MNNRERAESIIVDGYHCDCGSCANDLVRAITVALDAVRDAAKTPAVVYVQKKTTYVGNAMEKVVGGEDVTIMKFIGGRNE